MKVDWAVGCGKGGADAYVPHPAALPVTRQAVTVLASKYAVSVNCSSEIWQGFPVSIMHNFSKTRQENCHRADC